MELHSLRRMCVILCGVLCIFLLQAFGSSNGCSAGSANPSPSESANVANVGKSSGDFSSPQSAGGVALAYTSDELSTALIMIKLQKQGYYLTKFGSWEVYLIGLTAALMLFVIVVYCYFNYRRVNFEKDKHFDSQFNRFFIIIVIVMSTLYLVVAGYDEKQVAPVFGLLGTIIGYLFGSGLSAPVQVQASESLAKPEAGQGGQAAAGEKNAVKADS